MYMYMYANISFGNIISKSNKYKSCYCIYTAGIYIDMFKCCQTCPTRANRLFGKTYPTWTEYTVYGDTHRLPYL